MGSIDEISTLCRLCLVKDQVNKPIFDADSDIKQTFEKINSCLPVKVSPDDDLPKMICDGCFHKLDILYDFRSTSLESEKHLISLLEKAGLKSKPLTNDHESEKPITVKQENIEASDRLSEDENDDNQITDDSQSYIVQQQKLAYQKDFKFSAASGSKLEESVDDPDEPEEPKPKRARRAAALTAIKSLPIETEDDEEEEEDMDGTMEITKEEDEESDTMDNTEFPEGDEVPSTSTEDQQPGPSGVGKNVEAPMIRNEDLTGDQWRSGVNVCIICSQEFGSYASLSRHRQWKHPGNKSSKTFICDICSTSFRSYSSMWSHKRIHDPKFKSKVLKCDLCGKEFLAAAFQSYYIHRREHKNGKPTCSFCKKTFTTVGNLKLHAQCHNPEPYHCPHCKKTFTFYAGLKKHIRLIHEQKKYLCMVCGKILSTLTNFKHHLLIHEQIRPHICELCDKSFTKKTSLKQHIRVHTKEKPYPCKYCEKCFSQSTPRNIHIKTCHLNERPFSCSVCPKRFATQSMLTAHLKIHLKREALD